MVPIREHSLSSHRKAKCQKLDLATFPLEVYETDSVPSPCLVGLFKPQIFLLPHNDPRQQKHILTHEHTHYRHWDHIWSFIRGLCLCVYWFNPLVWVAAYLSKEDCELACDYGAIRALGEDERLSYGRTLVNTLAQTNHPGNLLRSATTMGGGKKQLRARIENIAFQPKKLLWVMIALILILTLTVGCTFTGGQESTPPQQGDINHTEPSEEPTPTHTEASEENDPADPSLADQDTYVVTDYEADGYAIPKLLDTFYGQKINSEIQERFGMIARGDYSQYQSLSYECFVTTLDYVSPTPQILVLDISAVDQQGNTEHTYYYIDLSRRTELSGTSYADEIRYRVSYELVQDLYDEQVNTGSISFTREDQLIYAENMSRSYNEARIEATPQGTLSFTIPYITMDGRTRDLSLSPEPRESISVNAIYDPQIIDLFTYTSDDGAESRVPFILLDSLFAKECNARLLIDYLYLCPSEVAYSWAVNGDILSFSIRAKEPYTDGYMCFAENFFLNGTSIPSTEDVLAQADPPMTIEEYQEKARVLLPSYFFDLFPDLISQALDNSIVAQQVLNCGTKSNIDEAKPYLDQNGNIWAYANIYQIAGSTKVKHLIPISAGKVNEEYLAFAEEYGLFRASKEALLSYLKNLYGEGSYELIYTAANGYPEYADDKIHCEALKDHIVIRLAREMELTSLTAEDIPKIPELKAAVDLLYISDTELEIHRFLRDENSNPDLHEFWIMDVLFASDGVQGAINRFAKVVSDTATKDVYILIYPGF